MSAPIEPDDPDVRVHDAWLAQISEAADGLVAKQVPKQDGGSTGVSAISSNPAVRLVGHDVPPPQLPRLGRRSGLIVMVLVGPSCCQCDFTTLPAFGELAPAHG